MPAMNSELLLRRKLNELTYILAKERFDDVDFPTVEAIINSQQVLKDEVELSNYVFNLYDAFMKVLKTNNKNLDINLILEFSKNLSKDNELMDKNFESKINTLKTENDKKKMAIDFYNYVNNEKPFRFFNEELAVLISNLVLVNNDLGILVP